MKSFAEIDVENNGEYLTLLSAVARLSGLFSENSIPFINYRGAENIFCKSFHADNLSRSDTAFDTNYQSIGVGLKTFTCTSQSSTEKVAEFNSLYRELIHLKEKKLVLKLAELRNNRIDLAFRLYNIKHSMYHIVARKDKELVLFETDYDKIDVRNIHSIKESNTSLQFDDGKNLYRFNYSKSTLFRKFYIPQNSYRIPIEIVDNPYNLLLDIFKNKILKSATDKLVRGVNYVILPLYGVKDKKKFIFERSGLNQWNARGRKRDVGEIYLPIPSKIHLLFPHFFPEREVPFELKIPAGEIFQAKVCQDHSKALMTNPNKALSDWLLRRVFLLQEGELTTYEKIHLLGFDSVIITKRVNGTYEIDKAKLDSYESFIQH